MRGSVTVHMSASPAVVWDLVSDVTRIGEFSPETFEAKWTRGSSGPEAGAYFKGHVKRNGVGPVYWTLCRVTECVPGEVFGFDVVMNDKPINTWTYRIAPADDGCDVTESFELAPNMLLKVYWKLLGRARGKTNTDGMRRTLERIRAVVESTEDA